MNLSRNELIKALVKGLKLDDNIFNYQAVAEDIETIQAKDFMDFYKQVMNENTFGNGLQAIMKVVERFKPTAITDDAELKAKELIELVHSMNNQVYADAQKMGTQFEDLLKVAKFPQVSDDDMTILNQVKPHCDLKQLISNINAYQTSLEQLKAFKNAIQYTSSYSGAIECSRVNKMIKG